MNIDMMVSIIIPAYNCEKTIVKTISCITSQSFSDFEVIVVNDGSSDNTQDTVKKLAQADNRITLLNVKNGGPAKARNIGMSKAQGKYIWFADSDDTMASDMLEKLICADKEYGHDMICSGYFMDTISDEGETLSSQIFTYGEKSGTIIADNESDISKIIMSLIDGHLMYVVWNKLYKKSFLLENELFFPDFMSGEDRLFNLNVLCKINSILFCPEPFYHYLVKKQGSLSGRFVRDRFDTALLCDTKMKEIMKRFSLTDEKSSAVSSFALLKQAMASITQLYIPSCTLSRNEKTEIIKDISHNQSIVEASQIKPQGGLSSKAATFIIKTKSVFLIKLFAKTINFLQIRCGALFLRLKHKR